MYWVIHGTLENFLNSNQNAPQSLTEDFFKRAGLLVILGYFHLRFSGNIITYIENNLWPDKNNTD
jgi:hypothetical protein